MLESFFVFLVIVMTLAEIFYPSGWFESLALSERAEQHPKARIALSFNLWFALACIAIFCLHFFCDQNYNASIFLLLFFATVSGASLILFKKTGKLLFPISSILLGALVIFPARTYYTGGITSPGFIWLFFSPVIIYALFEMKILLGYLSYVFFWILFFLFQKSMPFDGDMFISLFIVIFGFISLGFVLIVKKYTERKIILAVKMAEKIDTFNTMIVTLNHEINNPLAIATANVFKIKKLLAEKETVDNQTFEDLELALDRIKKIIKKVGEIHSEEEMKTNPYGKSDYSLFDLGDS